MGGLCSRRSTVDNAPVGGFPHVNGHFARGSGLVFQTRQLPAKISTNSAPPAEDSADNAGMESREPFSFPEISTVSYGMNPADIDDGIPRLSRVLSNKSRSTKSKQAAVAKVTEVGSLLGRAGTAGFGKAVDVLDTLGSSMTNLNLGSGFTSGVTTKGNKISILSFEVANTIVKGANLMQSLSKENIRHLKEVVLKSEGVQNLISRDMDELLRIAAADKREELKIFSGEVVRFGNRCKDPQWHNLDRYFEKLGSELTFEKQLKEEAETIMQQLMTYVHYTAELYHELHALDRFEQDYRRKLQEEDNSNTAQRGETGEDEVEYYSDPEEGKRSLTMQRRKAASDDEEGEGEVDNNNAVRMNPRAVIHSDESNSQGGAADYDDEEEELYSEEEEEEENYDGVEEEDVDEEEIEEVMRREVQGNVERTGGAAVVDNGNRNVDEVVEISNGNNHVGGEDEDEKKENEPFVVPTAGAFYMHDDRFRDNVGGRHRQMRGGRKLWESKDDRKWGHDKFEEMTLQGKHYTEGRRSSRGRYRAHSKNVVQDHGYSTGSRSKAFGKNYNQNQAPKAVRGRGPKRYEPTMKNGCQASPVLNKPSWKPIEKTSQANSSRASTTATNADTVSIPSKKHIFVSSLSSASPPFYPSGSSKKDISLTQRKDVQASRDLRPSVTDEKFSLFQSNLLRGKNVLDPLSMAKLYIDDSTTSASVKPLANMQMLPTGSSLGNTSQPSQSRVQGRGIANPGPKAYQSAPHHNQVNRVSPPVQVNAVQRIPAQGRAHSSVPAATQQLGQHPSIGSQAASPPKTAMSVSSYESGEVESSETSKPEGALVNKGKCNLQGAGRGSYLYGGAQIIGATGNMSISHGDQNFPAFLPVMQFGGQHSGGLGVPAVGMAFPGYVAQPQLGTRNSEMTWLPVLTGAAGALGPTYCPPYIAVDGAYNARPSGQTSSTGSSSKENISKKPNNEWNPSQRPELVNDELGQRQNNPNKQPRRYSEMSFSKRFTYLKMEPAPVNWYRPYSSPFMMSGL